MVPEYLSTYGESTGCPCWSLGAGGRDRGFQQRVGESWRCDSRDTCDEVINFPLVSIQTAGIIHEVDV